MYPKIEAKVVLARCQERKRTYGVRMEKTPLGWKYNWAFKISDKRANSEGYGSSKLVGNFYPDKNYPGCPYCKGKSVVVCGTCGRLTCNNSYGRIFTCLWCGAQGELVDYDGVGINSSDDV